MLRLYFLLIALVILIKTNAQQNFLPGYILSLTGDTLYGWVDYRSQARNSRVVVFKASESSEGKAYRPVEIAGYFVNKSYFYSKTIPENDFDQFVFMEAEVLGRISLYTYKDLYDRINYYVEKGDDFEALTNAEKEVIREDPITNSVTRYAVNSNRYLATLTYLFHDCEFYANKNLNIGYDLKSITHAVEKYNSCFAETPNQMASGGSKKIRFKKTFFVGWNSTNIMASNRNSYFNPAEGAAKWSFGVLGQIYAPNFNKKIGLDLGLFYKGIGATSYRPSAELNLHYLDFQPGISFAYPWGKFEPLLSAGGIIGFLLNAKSENFLEVFDNNTAPTSFGYYINAGFNYYFSAKNGLSVRFVYESATMSFNFVSVGFENRAIGLKLGFLF